MTKLLIDQFVENVGDAPALHLRDQTISYAELTSQVRTFSGALLGAASDLSEQRVALYLPRSPQYVIALFGTWMAGAIAVPLNPDAKSGEIEYALSTSGAKRLVYSEALPAWLKKLCVEKSIECVPVENVSPITSKNLPKLDASRRAMMLFTSGTTNKPKGVVTTHGNIASQVSDLVSAWHWSEKDCIALFLPLHHVHGIVNVLCSALYSGASVDLVAKYSSAEIITRVTERRYTLFMAVPTIYAKLFAEIETLDPASRQRVSEAFGGLRLLVSGSAACPITVHEKWRALSGQTLLERYGMTEIGMALSNPYNGERRPGTVGQTLPSVEVILVAENGARIEAEGEPGEIWVRGPTVFQGYWNNQEATDNTFQDGWFKTGDIAKMERGYFKILGRSSVDIIKTGGYKISALEIESVMLQHPAVEECAIVGMPDDMWGELVCAAIVLNSKIQVEADALLVWAKEMMSSYKVPKRCVFVSQLPRNAMGKITKPAVKRIFDKADDQSGESV
jgi:malonyl-CoA/methylmalonyl-CoA synthetase